MAAQTFIRWARLGVWERLLGLAQTRGVELGLAFLDGTSIRAHLRRRGRPKTTVFGVKLVSRPYGCGAWR